MTGIAQILAKISMASEPVEALRSAVLSQGGFWPDLQTGLGIFEVQLFGVVGIGPSQSAAADDWVVQASERLRGSL
jgi:hypothetical protein